MAKKISLKKNTAVSKNAKASKTVAVKAKSGTTRNRLMSIGYGAETKHIQAIDAAAKRKGLTRAKFIRNQVEKAI